MATKKITTLAIVRLYAQTVMQGRLSLVIFIFSPGSWVGQALCTNCHAKKTRKKAYFDEHNS